MSPASDELVYPLVESYVSHWTIVDAIRELYSNALDVGQAKAVFDAATGHLTISDGGAGLSREHLLLGVSVKGDDAIGQFGEGLKLALKCAAAEQRFCQVDTVGFSIVPSFQVKAAYGSRPVLVLTMTPNTRTRGTSVTVACTPDEWDAAQSLFWNPDHYTQVAPNLYTPGGAIFINGLKATDINSPFTYTMTDKTLTNRDRTVVDSDKLTATLLNFWVSAPEAAWIALLKAWNPTALAREFTLPWPRTAPPFLSRAAGQAWTKPVLWTDRDTLDDAARATVAGYTLLRNLPTHFEVMLYNAGIPPLRQLQLHNIAPAAADDGSSWTFPITDHYAAHLTRMDALMELAANAIDAGEPTISYEVPTAVDLMKVPHTLFIEDHGPGIKPEHLLLGQHDKPTRSIGQFGTGLKEAWVRLTALVPQGIVIHTVGRTYLAAFTPQPPWNIPLWTVSWSENTRTRGTSIEIPEATAKEVHTLRQRFLAFQPREPLAGGLIEGSNALFFRGMALAHEEPYAFAYDLSEYMDASLVKNRWQYPNAVAKVWAEMTDADTLSTYFKAAARHPDAFDFRVTPSVPRENYALWRDAARACWGTKLAVRDALSDANVRAQYVGYHLTPTLPNGVEALLRRVGIPQSTRVGHKRPTKAEREHQRSEQRQKLWETYVQAAQRIGWLPADVPVHSYTPDDQEDRTLGLYDSQEDAIYLRESLLDDPTQWVATLLHELTHRATGAKDLTTEFQYALTQMIGLFAFSRWDGVVSSSLHLLDNGDNSRWIDTAIGTLHKAAPVARYPFGFQDSDDTAVEDS